jgi:hypothetical protein
MNNSSSHQILLVGLPSTGKTSYLAALWYMVNQSNVDCRLSLEKLDGEIKYLNQIRDAWLEYKPVPRNRLDSETVASMALKDRETGREVGLSFPDLSGESFRLQWTERQFTSRYDERLRQASGAILFVHPERIQKPNRIDTVNDLADIVGGAVSEEEVSGETSQLATKPWDIEKTPTQVQLVELLQFVSSREYFRSPFRVAILVSAWDILVGLPETPAKWVSDQLPLLRQFLDCSEGIFDVAFYGVSAQGGRYASSLFSAGDFNDAEAFVTRLSQKLDPVSGWLWEQMGETVQTTLQDYQGAAAKSSETLQSLLAQNFNKLIAKAGIYDQGRFANVELRLETKELLNLTSVQKGEETVNLNRLLLEDAYPSALSRNRKYDKEVSELQLKLPARRVSLFGPNVKNPYDITEPLQWLMH